MLLVYQLLVILGGGAFVQTMPSWFAQIIGEAAGMAEAQNTANMAKAGAGMLKSGALGVAGALGIGTTAKRKRLDKFKTKSEFATMSAGAGSGIGGAEAGAPGVGIGMAI